MALADQLQTLWKIKQFTSLNDVCYVPI